MDRTAGTIDCEGVLGELLGYLNFSAGKPDAKFQRHISQVIGQIDAENPWVELHRLLRESLQAVRGTTAAFRDVSQAEVVLTLVFDKALPAYREHHADLLAHLSDRELFQPFFLARVFEAVLTEAGPWQETKRIVRGVIERLNDFIGHRPVVVLERRKCEPYDHERVRPIPLFIRGAGAVVGKYHDIVAMAIEILERTDPDILTKACFDVELLDELAIDPRAYDFSHPVNQRPNYQFGEWDPHCIDNQGRYRRLVVRQVTLDALLDWVQGSGFRVQDGKNPSSSLNPEPRTLNPSSEPRTLNPEPYLFEAAAVLAGTILMAAGTSGNGPDTFDSSVTLATLVPKIARYRDAFYSSLIESLLGPSGDRLRHEAATLHQPFGAARQHLNQYLARQRAGQMQHAHLAVLFARMGYPQASREQARVIPAAATRISTEMQCRLCAAQLHLDRSDRADAMRLAEELTALLHRGVACGAIIDPWNILGFQGQFSIFQARENSVPDPRVDELTGLIEQIFSLNARLWAEAAAAGDTRLEQRIATSSRQLAEWWDRFATVEVGGVRRLHGGEAVEAASHVARALAAWHQAGDAAGDIRFWREHSEGFQSPRAYAQVIHALLERHDFIATMALLVNWLSQASEVSLVNESHSFHRLAVRWMRAVTGQEGSGFRVQGSGDAEQTSGFGIQGSGGSIQRQLDPFNSGPSTRDSRPPEPRTLNPEPSAEPRTLNPLFAWPLVKKFFDFLEANAEEYWQVPSLELGQNVADAAESSEASIEAADDDESEEVYSAAYDGVTYRDSAEDGHEGETLDAGPPDGEFDLEFAAERIEPRLEFLTTLATLWQIAANSSNLSSRRAGGKGAAGEGATLAQHPRHPEQTWGIAEQGESLRNWLQQLQHNRRGLAKLLDEVQENSIPKPIGSHDSLVEYDRRRMIKERLIYVVIDTMIETDQAVQRLLVCLPAAPPDMELADRARHAVDFEQALIEGDATELRRRLAQLLQELRGQPLLYRRLDKGGHPREIVAARSIQRTARMLVESLPRVGLLKETFHVLKTARGMELEHPVRGEGITEFDRLFRAGLRASVRSVLDAAANWPPEQQADQPLLGFLEQLAEPFMKLWLEHSQSVRLSCFDRLSSDTDWQRLRQFIERYAHDLLTPKFLTFGNLRAVLDQGVARYLEYLGENPDPLHSVRLIEELDRNIRRDDANKLLSLVIEGFVENYEDYKDYNATTAQSDYGERYFILFEFLRLKALYDRTAWNLQPVAIVHECLARAGRADASHIWQQAFADKTAELADNLVQRLGELERRHGVRLRGISDRLNEQFVRPFTLDRIAVLIEPAVEEARRPDGPPPDGSFPKLLAELSEFNETPTGSGLDVPQWLRVLEAEVERVRARHSGVLDPEGHRGVVARIPLTPKELRDQLEQLE